MPDEPSALSGLFAALRPPQPEKPPPWQEAPQPLGDRLRAFEERRAATETGTLAHAAERAGERARRALEALLEDPRSAVLAQVRQAAAGDPAGVAGVIAGMQPGGKYAALRVSFDSVRAQEPAFADAYERAVGAIGQYGEARVKLGEHVASRRMDAGALDKRFDELDREVVQAAKALPGRKPGTSAGDDLMAKARVLAKFFADVVASGVVTAAHVLSAAKPSTPNPPPAVRPSRRTAPGGFWHRGRSSQDIATLQPAVRVLGLPLHGQHGKVQNLCCGLASETGNPELELQYQASRIGIRR